MICGTLFHRSEKDVMSGLELSADWLGLLAVLALVAANGFFVAAEFSLVSVRRSRVTELVETGRTNARLLQRATDRLDSNLAATQFGITLSSLALGWIGEPALAHLIEPLLSGFSTEWASAGAHGFSVAVAFMIITILHIVLGELAPKSLALQRSEGTALWVVRPLALFLFLCRPAIMMLNGLGNLVLRLVGLGPSTGEDSLHSPDELKLLVAESHGGGLLNRTQQELVERILNIEERSISTIMTPRRDVEWIDIDDTPEEIRAMLRDCPHEHLLLGRENIDEPLGMILKKDILVQMLDGQSLDLAAAIRQPVVVHETASVFRVLDQFKKAPVRLAIVVNEYGILEGLITPADLLSAIAGGLPDEEGERPDIVLREDGSMLIDGKTPAFEAFNRLGLRHPPQDHDFHTIAGFAIFRLGHLPEVGEHFTYERWRFEIVDMDGRRVDMLLVQREPPPAK